MKHHQVFGASTSRMKNQELLSAEAWDVLRQEHPFFSISSDRKEWLTTSEVVIPKDGQDKRLVERAYDVVKLVQQKNIAKIFSVGVGGAALEYQIQKQLPNISIVCSDYSALTVERLKKVFIESDEIIQFDVRQGNWKEIQERYLGENGLCLMYRIDAGFSDKEWSKIFQALSQAEIRNILVIPTGMLTLLSMYNRKKREILWFFKKIPSVFSGYVRTKKRFEEHWSAWYGEEELVFGGLKSFFLTKKD